jgi:alanine racemase
MSDSSYAGRLVANIDLGAVGRNVRRVMQVVGPNVRVMAMVKGNAYGHGAVPVARAAVEAGVSWLGVATLGEAAELREAGVTAPICDVQPFPPDEVERVITLGVTPVLSEIEQARALDEAAQRRGVVAEAHIDVDTGMGRSGIAAAQVGAFAAELARLAHLRISGLYTHFPSAEDDAAFTLGQVRRFEEAIEAARAAGIDPLTRHCANSAGLLLYPEARLDMVRPGLLVYGIMPELPAGAPALPDFEPVMTLRTQVLLARRMPRGATISYGRTCTLARDSVVGTLGVGYGDGYPRALSNIGSALVRGRRAPILGRVCMDATLVDLTDIPEAQAGDEAVLIGKQGDEEITAVEIARAIGTAEQDVTTRLTGRVSRESRVLSSG